MKVITIWQPWTSLLACGSKQFETRSWATSYRGPIAIHAAQRQPRDVMQALPAKTQQEIFDALYKHFNIHSGALTRLPTGAIIATAELVGCHKIVGVGWTGTSERRIAWVDGALNPHYPTEREVLFGDWTPGRYAWEMANVKLLDTPIPAKGRQGLWNWEAAQAGEGGQDENK